MKLFYDPTKMEFCVQTNTILKTEVITLRDFYIDIRKKAGISPYQLEMQSGLTRNTLAAIERLNERGNYSHSVKSILIALETLDYQLEITR